MPETTIDTRILQGKTKVPTLLIVESPNNIELIDQQIADIKHRFAVNVLHDTYDGTPESIAAIAAEAKQLKVDMVLTGNSYQSQYFGYALLKQLKAEPDAFAGPVAIQASNVPTKAEIAATQKAGGLGVYSNDVDMTLAADGAIAALVAEHQKPQGFANGL